MQQTPSASYTSTLRVKLTNRPGTLGEVTTAIGHAGGDIGAIDIVSVTRGKLVYAKLCAFCHETKIGPIIRGRDLDPLYIGFTVRHGNRAMPAFRQSEIDDESLQKAAEYVSKWKADQ